MVGLQEADWFDIKMNLKNILEEENTVIYVGEEIEKSDIQETLLQGFIVHSPNLGIIDFQEIKSKNLIRRSTPEISFNYITYKKMFRS